MKTCIKKSFVLAVLAVVLGSVLAGQVKAQTFAVLHSFRSSNYGEGGDSIAGLVLIDRTLFGAGIALFKLNTDGTAFTNFAVFLQPEQGCYPKADLAVSDGTLYGTASECGISDKGTVFKVNTDGTGYVVLHSFTAVPQYPSPGTNNDGAWPRGKLVLSGTTLFGTATGGGNGGSGTLFTVNTDGTVFSVIHTFSAADTFGGFYTNADGGKPGELILSGKTLYGTALTGGSGVSGTIFKVNTDGTGFTVLHDFLPSTGTYCCFGDAPDGSEPDKLILSGSTLFGTTSSGTSGGNGSIFKLNTDGTGFSTLHSFSGPPIHVLDSTLVITNSDGGVPNGLVLAGNILYGTGVGGGSSGSGTVFSLHTDGSGFRTLYNFSGTDGSGPNGVLLLGNSLYGTTRNGGEGGGTVFAISLPPELTLATSGPNLVLSWPTNFTGYSLQSTPNLASRVWTTSLPAPVIVNGQYTVSNPISGTQQFFRLSQ
jgi:uncharacterized repeat protein (TIGR03803 family)